MKNKLFYVLAMAVLVACSPSKEDKAQELVKNVLAQQLYHPESYKPMFISVDSAFASAYVDEECMSLMGDLFNLFSKIGEIAQELEEAERAMSIWSGPYQTTYGKHEYNEAKKKKEEQEDLMERARERVYKLYDEIRERNDRMDKKQFCGWIINHKYTSLNGSGERNIPGEDVYIANPELTSCFGYGKKEYDNLVKFMSLIIESEDMTDFAERFQEASLTLK